MSLTQIPTYDYLKDFKRVHIKINDGFFNEIKDKIIVKYKSLRNYNQALKIGYPALKWEFKKNNYHPFYRILKIMGHLGISKESLYEHILGFYHWGSHNDCMPIPRLLEIDEFFVEGYALYLAEGDTGFSGDTRPRKFRFTNSEIMVINHMIRWISTYFPDTKSYVNAINPSGNDIDFKSIRRLINNDQIRFKEGLYNKVIKYRLCIDSAIIIDLILAIEGKIKELCRIDKRLAAAYIRGMMIGEGTAYFNKSRYVRIEMRNEKEIGYLYQLFTLLGFECKPSLRSERHDMWSIYISAKQLKRYYDEIGFGINEKRQAILEKAINKKLRVNQYI